MCLTVKRRGKKDHIKSKKNWTSDKEKINMQANKARKKTLKKEY